MGSANSQAGSESHYFGGRWSAALSLWTYFHRLLHLLGILSIDREELALLQGHPVRVRHKQSGRALEHSASLTRGRIDALSLAERNSDGNLRSIFFAHFVPSPTDDVLQLATSQSPRAWVSRSARAPLALAHSKRAAVRFSLERTSSDAIAMRAVPGVLRAGSSTGALVSVIAPRSISLTAEGQCVRSSERFEINVIPLSAHVLLKGAPVDPTVQAAAGATRRIPIRVQARSKAFLCAFPGERVRANRVAAAGCDVFQLDHDAQTDTAVLRDSTSAPLRFTPQLDGFCSGDPDTRGERFVIELAPCARNGRGDALDDCVTLRSRKGYLSVNRRGDLRLERERNPGPRESFWLRLALPSMADKSEPRHRLQREPGGTRIVEASVEVPVDVHTAFEVISDYEGFSTFLDDAAESQILQRYSDRHLQVRMVQTHSFLVLTLNLAMTLDVHEFKEELRATMEMTSGFGVKEYRGTWSVIPKSDDPDYCTICCELRATPALPAPGFLVDGVITHATCATLSQLRVECLRRKALRKSDMNGGGASPR